MTVQLRSSQFSATVILAIFLKSNFLFHIHFSVVICDFLVISSQITIVPMHVLFRIHYRNNLISKKNSYLIPRPPSWDDRNYSYGHQLYPSDNTVRVQEERSTVCGNHCIFYLIHRCAGHSMTDTSPGSQKTPLEATTIVQNFV